MNTILITGTAKNKAVNISPNTVGFKVEYDFIIWGNTTGEDIQFIMNGTKELCGYGDLWNLAKTEVSEYFKDARFFDGAYTQYLDHLTIL